MPIMGSQKKQDELTVLVTGFGPFREQYPVNPSFEIAKRLPAYLPPLRAKDPLSRPSAAADLPPVRILVHPDPVRVSYSVVRELVPTLWDGRDKIDFAIHIGMAGPRPVYQIEHRAHRTGYKSRDVDGNGLEDEREGMQGKDWIWHGLPEEITTELDVVDILGRWMQHSSPDMDLRISEDPGRYLCDFFYYSSLAHLWKQQRERKVLFFHVPAVSSEQDIAQGLELAINLIRSIAESLSETHEEQA